MIHDLPKYPFDRLAPMKVEAKTGGRSRWTAETAWLAAAIVCFTPQPSMAWQSSPSRDALSDDQFAFPKQRKEPIQDAPHVRSAIARFVQVKGVSDAERDEAWARIKAAAKTFGVEIHIEDWRALGARRMP